ncbi:MAG: ABC transporter ATP-binding protein [Planctomycetales bacterium]|nr:ABC transporter ATP-binding protein [Planctomycetales bacterium]
MATDELVLLQDVVKEFRGVRALDGVSTTIRPGITGVLGPNGAGKSTLIKILLGLVRMTSGTGHVLGRTLGVNARNIREVVGYMPEDDCYIPGLTGIEVVQFAASMSGIPNTEAMRRSHEILDFCGMQDQRYRAIETYSTGMRQKIKFAAAIVHDPDLLILDEPTTGLDPEERVALLNRIRSLADRSHKSVILSTHILPDVQATCDHVLIMSHGQIRLSGSLRELERPTESRLNISVLAGQDRLTSWLQEQQIHVTTQPNGLLQISAGDPDLLERIWQAAAERQVAIQSLAPSRNSLEEIFMTAVKEAADASP